MANILLWGGLTLISATGWLHIPASDQVGSILMIIGMIILILEKRGD